MLLAAAESAEEVHDAGINPWVVGIIVLAIFTILMLGLMSFGKGREHS